MLETIAVILIGLIPGALASYLATASFRRYTQERRYYRTFGEVPAAQLLGPPLQGQDYHFVEGLGYIIGDLSCQFNARSPYLRCAINPAGPCKECPAYQSLHFPEEQDEVHQRK
jgi:hypothetical protein